MSPAHNLLSLLSLLSRFSRLSHPQLLQTSSIYLRQSSLESLLSCEQLDAFERRNDATRRPCNDSLFINSPYLTIFASLSLAAFLIFFTLIVIIASTPFDLRSLPGLTLKSYTMPFRFYRKTNGYGVQSDDAKICVVMVGLPARGKSLIAGKGMLTNNPPGLDRLCCRCTNKPRCKQPCATSRGWVSRLTSSTSAATVVRILPSPQLRSSTRATQTGSVFDVQLPKRLSLICCVGSLRIMVLSLSSMPLIPPRLVAAGSSTAAMKLALRLYSWSQNATTKTSS